MRVQRHADLPILALLSRALAERVSATRRVGIRDSLGEIAEPYHPIAAALRGENPKVIARMRSGFAVIGDTQHLPGYSLLLTDDMSVNHPTDLPWARRRQFSFDLLLLGEAVMTAGRERGVYRINYEVLGNSWNHLHGHVHARYEWEAPDKIGGPVWRYPKEVRYATEYAYDDSKHGELRAAITAELERLMTEAYAELDP